MDARFEEYAKYVDQFTPEKTQEITGVPADKIVAAARLWAQGPGSFTLTTQSLSHNSNGVNNTRGLLLLPILMGYIDIPGGVPFGQPPKGLSMAAFGLHPAMADKKWWNSPEVKARRLDKDELPLWHDLQDQTSPNNLPEWVRDGKVKVFCGWGFNVNIWPQPDVYNDALSKLDFAFATDYFHRKDSHRNMDIILPAAMNYERHAPFGWYGPNIAVRKPIKPLGEAKEDWRIALELGCIVDKPEHFFDGDPEKALDFILHQYEGGDLVKFRNALPQISRIPAPKPGFKKYEDGRLRPDGKPGFNTLSGKLDFFSDRAAKFGYPGLPVYKPMTELSKDFDLRLMNGSRKPYITHSKTRTDQPYLMEIEDCLHVNINPKDAEARGIKEGDTILITSPYGGPVEAKAVVSLIVPVGTIDAQYGWLDNQNTQKLMNRGNRDRCPVIRATSKIPSVLKRKPKEIVMSKYGIIVNADDCVGCHACFVACKEENQVAPGVKWNHLERLEHPAEEVIEYFRVSCMHCENPACMKVCPVKAVYFGPHGEVLIDQKKCIGCKGCLAACPYSAPKFSDPNKQSYFGDLKPLGGRSASPTAWTTRIPGKAEHCTLCTHRTSQGRLPACVEVCSTKALQLVDYDNPTDAQKALIAKAQIINKDAGTSPKIRFISSITDFGAMKVKA